MNNTDSSRTLQRWQLSTFLVAVIGYIGYYISRANLSAAFPLMSTHFGYTNSQLGLIAFYSEITYALGKLINGPLADKIGGKKIFLIGLMGAVISNFIFSLGSHLYFFVLAWCLCRYFLSMGWGGLTKMIGNWFPPERNGTVMGWVSLNFQFGGVVATLFAGLIVSFGGSWRDVFIYPPLLSFLIWIYSYLGAKESPQDVVPGTDFPRSITSTKAPLISKGSSANSGSDFRSSMLGLLRISVFRQLLVFSFLTTFLRSIFFFWTPKFLVDIGHGTAKGIFMSALFPLLGCVGTVLLGWYTDRFSRNGDRARMMWIMLLFLVASLVGISAVLSFEKLNPVWLMVLLGASGFFLLGPYSMSSGALTLDIAGAKAAGTCTGLIDGLGYVGGALAVWVAGRLSDVFGWQKVFLFLAGIAFLSLLSAYLMSREFQKIYCEAKSN